MKSGIHKLDRGVMNMCNKKRKMNDYGYSLVELIVTIVIIAVLASATAIAVVKYVRKSKVSADIEVAGELKSAAYNVATDAVAKYGSIANCTFVIDTETMTLTNATDLSQSPNEEALEEGDVKGFMSKQFKNMCSGVTSSKLHPGDYFIVTIYTDSQDISKVTIDYKNNAGDSALNQYNSEVE